MTRKRGRRVVAASEDRESIRRRRRILRETLEDPFQDVENVLSLLFHDVRFDRARTSSVTEVIDVNSVDDRGRTPLHLAAELEIGSLERTKYLLKHGANVDAKDGNNLTPVYYAARSENWDTCEMLLLNGAKVADDISRQEEVQGILAALRRNKFIRNGKYKTIQFEINWPIFSISDNDYELVGQCTILHLAVYSKCVNNVEILLKKGAEVDVPNSRQATPLHVALSHSGKTQKELLDLLVNFGANVSARDCERRTPLHKAIQMKSKEVVRLLLQKNANINEQDKRGLSPLHLAVQLKDEEITKELLSQNANINIRNGKEETPLHYATSLGWSAGVKLLLEQDGIEVDALDDDGNSPLLVAADKGYSDILRLLAEHGANVNAEDKNKRTALFKIIMNNDVASVKYLLEKGAKVNIKDKQLKLPIYYAVKHAGVDILKALIDAKTEINLSHLKIAVENDDLGAVTLLLDELKQVPEEVVPEKEVKIDKNKKMYITEEQKRNKKRLINDPYHDCNILLLSLSKSSDEIVRLLLDKGADLENEVWKGLTPAACAQFLQRDNIVPRLIRDDDEDEEEEEEDDKDGEEKEDEETEDEDIYAGGKTALHKTACGKRSRALANVMKWLSTCVDNSIVQDDNGDTPLHLACGKGRFSVVKYLAENCNRKCLNMRNKQGLTPWDIADRSNRKSVLKFLGPSQQVENARS